MFFSAVSSTNTLHENSRIKTWISCVLICMSSVCVSCMRNERVEYVSFSQIHEDGMPENWEFEFSPVPTDSGSIGTVPYDVILVLRYSASTQAKEIMLDLEEFSLRQDIPDTLHVKIPLFDKLDNHFGRGTYTIYEIADTLRKHFPIPDGYTISVSSPLPEEDTRGIKSVGIILSRTNFKNN